MTWQKRLGLVVFLAAAAVLAIFAMEFVKVTNLTRGLEPLIPESCDRLPGVTGPEDIVIDRELGLAYITTADRHGVEHRNAAPDGAIMLLDLRAQDRALIRLEGLDPATFFPHGLDLLILPDGERRLYAVNHGADGQTHTIEEFRIDDGRVLVHLRTIADPMIYSPNDVAAIAPDHLYITNDIGSRGELMRQLEPYLMLPRGNVVMFRDGTASQVAGGLRYANGVIASPDRTQLYVAGVLDESIFVYDIMTAGRLQKSGAVEVNMGLDNITVAPDGSVWTAGHPKPLAFGAHAADPAVDAPAEVVRARPERDGEGYRTQTVLLDPIGDSYSAASVAAVYDGDLLVGAVYEDALLICPGAGS